MTTAPTLPDLWPASIKQLDVRSPRLILKFYAEQLTRHTAGVVRGELSTVEIGSDVEHILDVIAPAAGGLRRRILSAQHDKNGAYPVWLFGAESEAESPSTEFDSESEFLSGLGKILASSSVVATIQSLVARSNDAKTAERVATAVSAAKKQVDKTSPPQENG
jgi:hypothetical protein